MIVEHCGNVRVITRHYQCMSIVTEILQRFHGAPTISIYRAFMVTDYVNLQRFYGAPTMSIYRDFAEIS